MTTTTGRGTPEGGADDAKSRLLELLQGDAAGAAPEAAASDPFELSLVRLQPEGQKRPFFCVHPGSGTVACFMEVAHLVGHDRPFLAFQPPGLDRECEPVTDLRTLANGYLRQMRKVQPHGPYALGGWSAGGNLAFQMAHELRAAGEEVSLLVMCDTMNTDLYNHLPLPPREIATYQYRQLGLMVEHLASQRGKELAPGAAFARFDEVRPRFVMSRIELMLKILLENGVVESVDSPFFEVFRATLLALTRYVPPKEPLDAPVTLLRCKNEEFGWDVTQVDPTYGWSSRTTRPVEVVEMPSHHFAMFHGAVAPITAQTLRRLLDATDRS